MDSWMKSSKKKRLFQDKGWKRYSTRRGSFRNVGNFMIGVLVGGIVLSGVLWVTEKWISSVPDQKNKKKVVILGSGWGGLSCASEIDTKRYEVTIVSPRDHLLVTPFLSDVTFSKFSDQSLTESVRSFLKRFKKDISFFQSQSTDIDPEKQIVYCSSLDGKKNYQIKYDKLIVAVGSVPNTYGISGVENFCHFLKGTSDTRTIRNKIMECFESANLPGRTEAEIQKLLQFVVVGGGPTSIYFSLQLHDLVTKDLPKYYPNIANKAKITIINTGDYARNTYDSKISSYYVETYKLNDKLSENSIKLVESNILRVDKDAIHLEGGNKLPFSACIWLTNGTKSDLVTKLKQKKPAIQNHQNALITDDYLKVKGFNNIYAIGDSATIDQKKLKNKIISIFHELDINQDGFIDEDEFENLVHDYSREFPQLLEYAKKSKYLFEQGDVNKDGKLSFEEFTTIIEKLDSIMTGLPSTAQVAQQQGRYVAQSLNNILRESEVRKIFHQLDEDGNGELDIQEVQKGLRKLQLPAKKRDVEEFILHSDSDKSGTIDEEEFVHFVLNHQQQGGVGDWKKVSHTKIKPFRYKHLGGFEYVGYDQKITERGSQGKSILDGFGAWWLWNSILISPAISGSNRFRILSEKLNSKLFGGTLPIKD